MGIVNDAIQPFYADNLFFSGKILKKVSSAVTVTYEPKGSWNASWMADTGNTKHKTFRMDQHLTLGIMPTKQLNISATVRHSFSHESKGNDVQYFFMDAKATYIQKRMDLSLSVNNVFNVTNYTRYSLTPYQLITDRYQIRGRMGILRLSYYF